VVTADGAVEVFAGIPYAAPPVGELRWREPQDPESWEGVLAADHFAPMSMQPTNLPIYNSLTKIVGFHNYQLSWQDNYRPPASEDSLYLNIWRPAVREEALPVLVYIHGGSLQTGQTWFGDYSGVGLARQGVIVVNLAYRLGVFGYLAEEELLAESGGRTTGNYGMLDQVKALRWVHDNITRFGGDPANITVAGESAGAASVSALCTSPLTEGLFRRVILESSTVASVQPPHSFRLLPEALASGADLMDRYGCADVQALRALPAAKLVGEADTQHHMTVDGFFLTETPYESYRKGYHHEEALLHGYNSEESGPFVLFNQANLKNYEGRVRGYFGERAEDVLKLYPAATDEEARANWQEIWGAVFFDYPHYCLNRLEVRNGVPVYEYRFSKKNGSIGPWHSGEMIYAYANIPPESSRFSARDRELSREMSGYFKNYIATGDPNGDGLPAWEENLSGEDLMGWGEVTAMEKESKLSLYRILDEMDGWEED
nr:carboxylesterase family protein [Clostridia bacterium]